MTILDVQTPVGKLVVECPARALVFERLGIDYGCGGRMPLAQACAAKGLVVEEVLPQLDVGDALEAGAGPGDGSGATLGELVDHIVVTHHTYLRQELPRLAALVDHVAHAHGDRHPELKELRDVFLVFKGDLQLHMLKEEEILFSAIKLIESVTTLPDYPCYGVSRPILVMEQDHGDAGAALERLRSLTGGYAPPEDACPSLRALLEGLADLEADMHRHIHKENNILFPRVRAAEAALRAWTSRPH